MKKLLMSLTVLMVFTSLSSFAALYEGRGETAEEGTEACSIDITKLKNGKLKLRIFGLGSEVESVVENKNTFKVVSQGSELPKEDIEVTGILNNGKPVLFKMKVSQSFTDEDNGEEQVFVDEMTCNF